jgi:hypothetical protein
MEIADTLKRLHQVVVEVQLSELGEVCTVKHIVKVPQLAVGKI